MRDPETGQRPTPIVLTVVVTVNTKLYRRLS